MVEIFLGTNSGIGILFGFDDQTPCQANIETSQNKPSLLILGNDDITSGSMKARDRALNVIGSCQTP